MTDQNKADLLNALGHFDILPPRGEKLDRWMESMSAEIRQRVLDRIEFLKDDRDWDSE